MTPKTERRVWQIACGESGRYYDDLFLEHDVMFLGPGEPGPYNQRAYQKAVADGDIRKSDLGRMQRFAHRVQPDDIILLRKGTRAISLGIARDQNFYYCDALDDVYGWQLQHCRNVCWQPHLHLELERLQARGGFFPGRMSTFTRVKKPALLSRIEHLFDRCTKRPVKSSPAASPILGLEELGQLLFGKGLPNSAVDQVLRALERQRRLVTWYRSERKNSGRPTEHEVVAHMVLPLLLALGWSEQLLAVEWKSIDLAAFHGTPSTTERCVLVCEVKKGGAGMQDVWRQAHEYVQRLKLRSCRMLLVSEGARFYLYSKSGRAWPEKPTGYLNVEKIRQCHVAPKGTSAVETIAALTPMKFKRA